MNTVRTTLSFRVNGDPQAVTIPTHRTLLDVLRDDLALTGAKKGCNAGTCGACNVLVDEVIVRSCLCLAASVAERNVTTVEGLDRSGIPSVVQQAFLDAGAIQCGFCMTGMIMSATALLAQNAAPSREDIRVAISGNLCRCSGYVKVIDAVELAASRFCSGAASEAGVMEIST
jgi:aerobic-type carbon monoxide dehydrogenase small subunit (CoxS/CutS family)